MLQDGGLWDGLSGFGSLKTGLSALSALFCPQQRARSLVPRPFFLCKTGLARLKRFLCEIADLLLLNLLHQQGLRHKTELALFAAENSLSSRCRFREAEKSRRRLQAVKTQRVFTRSVPRSKWFLLLVARRFNCCREVVARPGSRLTGSAFSPSRWLS